MEDEEGGKQSKFFFLRLSSEWVRERKKIVEGIIGSDKDNQPTNQRSRTEQVARGEKSFKRPHYILVLRASCLWMCVLPSLPLLHGLDPVESVEASIQIVPRYRRVFHNAAPYSHKPNRGLFLCKENERLDFFSFLFLLVPFP